MKKILILFMVLFLSSCLVSKEDISESGSEENIVSITVEDLDEGLDYPEGYDITDGDIGLFYNMLNNNEEFFKSEEDKEFFNIWRGFLFGEDRGYSDLFSCLEGTATVDNLNEFEKNICIGENKYIENEDRIGGTNFFHIKETLIKFKQIKNGLDLDCGHFANLNYDYDSKAITNSKISDYFICNKMKDENYDLLKNHFIFYSTLGQFQEGSENLCDQLTDNNLKSLCNEKVKEYSENLEK